jgi:hypothetical protein
MNSESKAVQRAAAVDEVSKWTVGLGIITISLFALSLPILLLTAVALAPLLLPLVAFGLIAGVVAIPFLMVRGLVRRIRRARRRDVASERLITAGEPAHHHP